MNLPRSIYRLSANIIFEIKGMKIYWLQLLVSMLVMPFALLFIMLFSGNLDPAKVGYGVTGFIIVSLAGSFIGVLALRITNMMMPSILELYATFSVSRREMVSGMGVTYLLLSLPQILFAIAAIYIYIPVDNTFYFLASLLISIVTICLISIWLGLKVKNYFLAMGLFPFITWILVLLTPAYYEPGNVNNFWFWLIQVNPLTQCLNIMRNSLGYATQIPVYWSFLYLVIGSSAILWPINRDIKKMFILEKY